MASRSVNVGGNAVGNVFVAGDNNKVDAQVEALSTVTLPPANSVNIVDELAQIRAILSKYQGDHASKIERALDDASEEASKPGADKDEVGSALTRALDYAKKGGALAEEAQKLAPHITGAVAWLGSNWHKLLPLVGLTL